MIRKRLLSACVAALLAAVLTSCSSGKFTNMVYLADSVKQSQLVAEKYEYRLQPGDRVQILVTALNAESAIPFNVTPVSAVATGIATNNISATGYLIDPQGYIQFPQKGAIKVAGMTLTELAAHIKTIVADQLKEPVVIANISNFRVNILGEVARPSALIVPDGKITILEALSQAGDLTIYGKRENVMVVREKNGRREFGTLNLASKTLFESPYYNLEQGDVVYVEMNKNRLLASDVDESRRFRIISIILAAITAISLFVYRIL